MIPTNARYRSDFIIHSSFVSQNPYKVSGHCDIKEK